MTHIFSLSNEKVHVSDFTLKALVHAFLLHCQTHDIPAGFYVLTEYKASHDPQRGEWEEKNETGVWIDPVEDFDVIYEVLRNV